MTEIDVLQPLGREALSVRRLRVLLESLMALVVVVAALVVLERFLDPPDWLWGVPALVLLAGAVGWWWAAVDYSRWRWRLTSELFEVQRGVLFRKVYLVPRSRIQNVTTQGGPLQRRFGVLTLTVHTAGMRTKNVDIHDIDARHAEEIRRRLGLL